MAQIIQFDGFDTNSVKPHCIACEELLADALDGTLGAAERTFFDRHLQTCVACSEMLGHAQRGAAWLELLKTPRPEPSADLLTRILAETSERSAGGMQAGVVAAPVSIQSWPVDNVVAFRPRWPRPQGIGRILLEPRLAMTAAMAFFSITLTLNLMGVRLTELRASDLTPAGIRHSCFAEGAQAMRYYDNLRVVHVVESRVDDLRQHAADEEMRDEDTRQKHEQHRQEPVAPGPGTSRQEIPERQSAKPLMASVLLRKGEGGQG